MKKVSKKKENEIDVDTINLKLQEKPPKGYKINPLYIEKKSKRVQLVLQPSLYKKVKIASKRAGLSLNEYAHRIFEEVTKNI